jgi:hypothetical protein
VVAIQPEKRIHRNNDKSLAVGAGVIIARLINRDTLDSYPPLNLGPGDTVYWGVDQVKPPGRDDVSTGRSLYISTRGLRSAKDRPVPGTQAVLSIPMHVREHPSYKPWKQALARWIPVDSLYPGREAPGGDEGAALRFVSYKTWGGCKSQACCGP